jgi:ABC-type glycerol-3-phosphate transport system permease component
LTFLGSQNTSTGVIMAGVTLSVLPPLIVFLVLQRSLVEGIAVSGSAF